MMFIKQLISNYCYVVALTVLSLSIGPLATSAQAQQKSFLTFQKIEDEIDNSGSLKNMQLEAHAKISRLINCEQVVACDNSEEIQKLLLSLAGASSSAGIAWLTTKIPDRTVTTYTVRNPSGQVSQPRIIVRGYSFAGLKGSTLRKVCYGSATALGLYMVYQAYQAGRNISENTSLRSEISLADIDNDGIDEFIVHWLYKEGCEDFNDIIDKLNKLNNLLGHLHCSDKVAY